ncbi:hypothetical protein Sjap_022163 [Stephania japonica]|uniref:Uncharacterized protein n=1 Tax=Stephania japonica TaxID=461633 RepID=A0AAP0END3_9MAGN
MGAVVGVYSPWHCPRHQGRGTPGHGAAADSVVRLTSTTPGGASCGSTPPSFSTSSSTLLVVSKPHRTFPKLKIG